MGMGLKGSSYLCSLLTSIDLPKRCDVLGCTLKKLSSSPMLDVRLVVLFFLAPGELGTKLCKSVPEYLKLAVERFIVGERLILPPRGPVGDILSCFFKVFCGCSIFLIAPSVSLRLSNLVVFYTCWTAG